VKRTLLAIDSPSESLRGPSKVTHNPMVLSPRLRSPHQVAASGLTLVEVVVALGISTMAIAGIISSYLFSIAAAQKSTLSMAASAQAIRRVEETRSAKWDTSSWPQVDQLVQTNFQDEVVVLDHGAAGNGITYGTNSTQILLVSLNPPLKKIHVDCVWNFKGTRLITNSVETCRAPDQ
jgi:type II secretory pathway pseudopilin PulG